MLMTIGIILMVVAVVFGVAWGLSLSKTRGERVAVLSAFATLVAVIALFVFVVMVQQQRGLSIFFVGGAFVIPTLVYLIVGRITRSKDVSDDAEQTEDAKPEENAETQTESEAASAAEPTKRRASRVPAVEAAPEPSPKAAAEPTATVAAAGSSSPTERADVPSSEQATELMSPVVATSATTAQHTAASDRHEVAPDKPADSPASSAVAAVQEAPSTQTTQETPDASSSVTAPAERSRVRAAEPTVTDAATSSKPQATPVSEGRQNVGAPAQNRRDALQQKEDTNEQTFQSVAERTAVERINAQRIEAARRAQAEREAAAAERARGHQKDAKDKMAEQAEAQRMAALRQAEQARIAAERKMAEERAAAERAARGSAAAVVVSSNQSAMASDTAFDPERYFMRATLLRDRGLFVAAAKLYAECASLTDDDATYRRATIEQIASYVKGGMGDQARELAEQLKNESTTLTMGERIKVDAVLKLAEQQ